MNDEILGYTSEELLGHTFLDISHPDDVDASRQALRQLLDRTITAQLFEKRYIRKDGSEVWSWTTVTVPLVESARPDVLITDIGMPGADGYELLRRVRELGPGEAV